MSPAIIVSGSVVVATFGAVWLGLLYSQASLVFLIIALALARTAALRPSRDWVALGLMMGLAYFASFPLKKLFDPIMTPLWDIALTVIYFGIVYLAGFGWRRGWDFRRGPSGKGEE
jgi:hypothetical protein